MINKNTDIRYIKGIGEKRAELFNKLGVFCVGDLLRYLPRGYEDRTDMRDICDIEEGESVCIKGFLPAEYARSERKQERGLYKPVFRMELESLT